MMKFVRTYIRAAHFIIRGGIGAFVLLCCSIMCMEGITTGMLAASALAVGSLIFGEILYHYLYHTIMEIYISNGVIELISFRGSNILLEPIDIKNIKLDFMTYKIVTEGKQGIQTYRYFLNVMVDKFGKKHKEILQDDFLYADLEL